VSIASSLAIPGGQPHRAIGLCGGMIKRDHPDVLQQRWERLLVLLPVAGIHF
jgi:hypothetical protein